MVPGCKVAWNCQSDQPTLKYPPVARGDNNKMLENQHTTQDICSLGNIIRFLFLTDFIWMQITPYLD